MIEHITQIIVIFMNLILGCFVLSQNTKSQSHRIFSFMSLTAAVWTYMNGTSISLIWLQSSYAFGALVISTGLIWTISITDIKLEKRKIIPIILLALFFCFGSFLPGFIIRSYHKSYSGAIPYGNYGWGLPFYSAFYLIIAFLIIWKLYKAAHVTVDQDKRNQLMNICYGALITLLVTAVTSFILPYFSIFPFGGMDNAAFLIFLSFIAYSITRHHLFNIRVITIELVTFALWIFILIRVLLSTTPHEVLTELGLLMVTVIFGVILIRSTLHEIRQREHIEKLAAELRSAYGHLSTLNDHLEQKVEGQTQEVRKAYEIEKVARLDLEKLASSKDQLIAAAQHNLRTPLTALRWQLEVIRNNSKGKGKDELQAALKESESSVDRLSGVLEDFLSITALTVNDERTEKKN